MSILMDWNHLFSSPELLCVQGIFISYPAHVVSSDEDVKKQLDKEKTIDIVDYLLKGPSLGIYFEALDSSQHWNKKIVAFLINPKKTTLNDLLNHLREEGIELEIQTTTTIKGRFGFYRF